MNHPRIPASARFSRHPVFSTGWLRFALLLAACSLPSRAASSLDAFGEWETVFTAPGFMRGVAFGNDSFVAVGSGGVLLASRDGVGWSRLAAGNLTHWGDVIFSGNRFIAVGQRINGGKAVVLVSPDGFNWTGGPVNLNAGFGSLAFGNGRYVAIGGDKFSSPDAATWTAAEFNSPWPFSAVAFGNQTFVTVGYGVTETSTDGVNWTLPNRQFQEQFGGSLNGVAFGNGVFVTAGDGSLVGVSTNGTNWSIKQLREFDPNRGNQLVGTLWDVRFVNDRFVLNALLFDGGTGALFTSTNGVDWSRAGSPFDRVHGLAYGHGLYVAAGGMGGVAISTNLQTWTRRVAGSDNFFTVFGSIAANRQAIVAAGRQERALIAHSQDGGMWNLIELPEVESLADITTDGTNFVTVGSTPQTPCIILGSSNGLAWTVRHSDATPGSLTAIAHGGGRYVAVGINRRIMTSTNGETWTRVDAGVSVPLFAVVYGKGMFVAAGSPDASGSPVILASTNGVDWQRADVPPGKALSGLTFGYGAFVAVRSQGPYLTSTNGLTWTSHDAGGAYEWATVTTTKLSGVQAANGWFIAGDSTGLLSWTSNDLETWSKRGPVPGRYARQGEFAFAVRDGNILRSQFPDPLTRLSVQGAYSVSKAGDNGEINLHREGSTRFDLEIDLEVSGTAIVGEDYEPILSRLLIPAGQSEVIIPVRPLPASVSPGTRTLTLTALPGDGYSISGTGSATVLVVDAGPSPRVRSSVFRRLPDGTSLFFVEMPSSGVFTVEASSDLRTWTSLQTVTADGSLLEVRDSAPGIGQRFYRLRSP